MPTRHVGDRPELNRRSIPLDQLIDMSDGSLNLDLAAGEAGRTGQPDNEPGKVDEIPFRELAPQACPQIARDDVRECPVYLAF